MHKAKERKTFREMIAYYNRTGIQEYLESKALDGWRLVKKLSVDNWEFECIEPKKLHYAITYLPQFSNEDDFLLSENKKEYLELCAEQGWQFACAYKDMVIFYNEEENPLPLETDPEVELDIIHKSVMKRVLPKSILSVALFVVSLIGQLFFDTVPWEYYLLVCVLLMISLYGVLDFFVYLRWRKKALAAAAMGEFSRTGVENKIVSALMVAVSIAVFAIIILKSVQTHDWEKVGILVMFTVYTVCKRFLDNFKKELEDGWQKRAISVVSILLYFALATCMFFILENL